MIPMKFTLLVAVVLITALVTNANDSYEAVDVDAISSSHSKGLGADNVDNGIASSNNFVGRKFGGQAKNVATNEGGYGKKQTLMKVGNKQNAKERKNGDASGSGFVAFNVDYHAPWHHPPKNN